MGRSQFRLGLRKSNRRSGRRRCTAPISKPSGTSSTRNRDTTRSKSEELVMNISFENKVALVTGAGSGLGLATARAFAESGASVVLADWNEKTVHSAAEELADDAQVEAMVQQTVATFGQLDAAYNNAGIQNVLGDC